ncbi:MAG: gephyrin-like molybdotransferase Glp [Actinomycetota bacterium]
MKPLKEARAEVLDAMRRLPTLTVAVDDALGMVVADDAVARGQLPPFDNSAVDGYALVASNVENPPVELAVNEDVAAGSVPTIAVRPGTATRIMTGAPMPDGADAVVRVEDTVAVTPDLVRIAASVQTGADIRPAGDDMVPGDVIVKKGVRLTSRHLGSLASAGIDPVVSTKPTVAIMSTGDEVVETGTEELEPGKIRDSNRVLLKGVLAELGVPVLDLGIIGDDVDELKTAYERAAAEADAIISTGGVSMGDYDFVKQVLGDLGNINLWKVAMQPGKPFAFGKINGVPLFGLPGNPVSTFVSFEQFVRPALLHMMGATKLFRPHVPATMGEDVHTNDAKTVFVRVLVASEQDGSLVALQAGGQGSNLQSTLANAEALAVVPVGTGSLSAGDAVTLEMYRWPEERSVDG